MGQQLASQFSSETMLDNLVERIRQATKADVVTLYPYIDNPSATNTGGLGPPHISGRLLKPQLQTSRDADIVSLALQRDSPVWASDSRLLNEFLADVSGSRADTFEKRESIQSTAVLRLEIESEPVGVLFISFRSPQQFGAMEKHLITSLANFAAIAIKSHRGFWSIAQRRLEELEVLRDIDREISQTLDLHEITQNILLRVTQRIPADSAAILLYDERTGRLETHAYLGPHPEKFRGLNLSVIDEKGIAVWSHLSKIPVRVDNGRQERLGPRSYRQLLPTSVSEIDVPLLDGEKAIGLICLESNREAAFSEADESFLVTLASQAVRAIINAKVFEDANSARRSMEVLYQVSQEIIIQHGDPEAVVELILRSARRLTGAEMGTLQLYVEGRPGKTYINWVDVSTGETLSKTTNGAANNEIELGIMGHVAATRLPYVTKNAQTDPYYAGSNNIHSEVAVPLISRDDPLIGVLTLQSPRQYAFDESDLSTLHLFAGQAAIAIQNAHDYRRAKDESKRLRLLWEAGREFGEITDSSQLNSAYDIVIRKVAEFSQGEVVIRRYDAAREELVLTRVLRQQPGLSSRSSISINEGIHGRVAREKKTIRLDDLDNVPSDITSFVEADPHIKSMVVTPIIFERSYYGNLALSNEVPHSFSDADVYLLEGLGTQLALTIHRLEIARAKQEAEQQARDLSIISEVGQFSMEIAHRLGNELKPVELYAAGIRHTIKQAGIDNPEIEEDLMRVEKSVKALLSLAKGMRNKIADLDDLTRERSVVPVKELLAAVIDETHISENVEILLDIDENLPQVSVVFASTADVLHNLITNAVEAMPTGGTIKISASCESKNGEDQPQQVLVSVTDTGPGIPLEMQAKVFNLFFSTKKSSGFGLWSARQYARANGGDLTLKSEVGKGATFILSLPVAGKDLDAKPTTI